MCKSLINWCSILQYVCIYIYCLARKFEVYDFTVNLFGETLLYYSTYRYAISTLFSSLFSLFSVVAQVSSVKKNTPKTDCASDQKLE
jgi:hypothetical protein